jgi:hypothetical protein
MLKLYADRQASGRKTGCSCMQTGKLVAARQAAAVCRQADDRERSQRRHTGKTMIIRQADDMQKG